MGKKLSNQLILAIVFFSFALPWASSNISDPYSLIGVSRTASQKEIKKAYKNLARQWHPDKNREEGAQEKFIQIQQAYEILSNEEKRAEYDLYGHVDTGNQPRRQNRHDPFAGFHFAGSRFDGFQFRYTNQGSSAGSDPRRVTLEKFENGILPESHRKPFLLFVTGDWCFSCVRVEEMWNEALPELEKLGIGMGTVYGDYSRNLLRKLGVHQWPSIVGIIEGRVVIFDKNHVNTEKLKEFAHDLLPSYVILKVTDANQETFFSGWHDDNRPRSLLFSRRSAPSLLYHLLAFKYRRLHTFGFAQNQGEDTIELVWKFDVSAHEPTLLIFKEDDEEYVDKIQSSKIDTSLLEDAVTRNQYLFVPRLTSQQVYEDLCPESPGTYRRRFCVILITKNPSVHKEHRDFFRLVAKTTDSFPGEARLVHLYQETQQEFVRALGDLARFDSDGAVPVAVLWRQSGRKVAYDWLPEGWHGNEPEKDKIGLSFFLQQIVDKKFKLGFVTTLPELKDENAPHWILERIYSFLNLFSKPGSYVKQALLSAWSESSIAVLVVLAYLVAFFLAFAGLLNAGVPTAHSKEAMDHRANGSMPQGEGYATEVRGRSQPDSSNLRLRIHMQELNESTYEKFLASGRQGHILLLLLTDQNSKDTLCQLFKQEAHMHIASQPFLVPVFLMLDKYKHWLANLRSQSENPSPFASPNGVGTVLAIRPSKSYYFVFKPRQGQRSRRRRGEIDISFVGLMDSSDSESDEFSECMSLDRLGMWLDRLLDGSLPKVTVNSWPSLE
ncbi:dnaJ homolog subfamily C member 16-like isoform X2 [Patiria miniata]|uniref:DnaJ homolog subfamily C member 16 n=1 Tax=Patiria miniata TaxID=46514 RepID=A0A914BMZ3_PATMI|nr:dnaJ homolog subfamily C member 16-like isoform X2 [Patiria miniata]